MSWASLLDRERPSSMRAILAPKRSRVNALPAGRGRWNEAPDGARASMRGVVDDTPQPAGVIGDVGGLPAAGDEARLARRRRVR